MKPTTYRSADRPDLPHYCTHPAMELADGKGLGCPFWPGCVNLDLMRPVESIPLALAADLPPTPGYAPVDPPEVSLGVALASLVGIAAGLALFMLVVVLLFPGVSP
jgi:hypothetical protein